MEILKQVSTQALIVVGAVGLLWTIRMTIWPQLGEDVANERFYRPDLFENIADLLALPLIEEAFFRGIPLLLAGVVSFLGGGEMGRIIIYTLTASVGNTNWARAHNLPPHAEFALLTAGFLFVYLTYAFGIWAAILGHATWNALCLIHAIRNLRTLI